MCSHCLTAFSVEWGTLLSQSSVQCVNCWKEKKKEDICALPIDHMIDDSNYDSGVSVVYFMAASNKHCAQISPFVDTLCTRYPSLNFLKVSSRSKFRQPNPSTEFILNVCLNLPFPFRSNNRWM